jgi:hypothetical protein
MQTKLIDQISRDLNLNRGALISQGIRAFLKEKKMALLLERLELLSRHRVASGEELQQKIAAGAVADHPAWEDLIVVENLDAELNKIDGYLENL